MISKYGFQEAIKHLSWLLECYHVPLRNTYFFLGKVYNITSSTRGPSVPMVPRYVWLKKENPLSQGLPNAPFDTPKLGDHAAYSRSLKAPNARDLWHSQNTEGTQRNEASKLSVATSFLGAHFGSGKGPPCRLSDNRIAALTKPQLLRCTVSFNDSESTRFAL